MSIYRSILTLLAFSVLAGCAPAAGIGDRVASTAPAPTLLALCPAGSEGRMQCLEQALLDTLRTEGIAAAMASLERIGAVDDEIRRDGHVYAHVIGLAAYTTPDVVGRSFAECTPAFQSGCYHGVIQSYFVDLARSGQPLTEQNVNELCAAYRTPATSWLLFQCAHGMGHGLTMVEQYHLPSALAACDMVDSPWERDACHGGVFMENIINETAPHHTTGRPGHGDGHGEETGHSGHAGPATAARAAEPDHQHHDHAAHAAAVAPAVREPFPALDPSDPHYPCSALDDRYQQSCYLMQTSVVLHFTNGDFAAAAQMCDGAPEGHRETCYQSLGRDASSWSVQVHRRGLQLCSVGDPALRSWCHVGYTKNVIDITANPQDGIDYCQLVPSGLGKEHCYRAVGQQIYLLAPEPEKRAALCETVERGYAAQCRAGADLPERAAAGS